MKDCPGSGIVTLVKDDPLKTQYNAVAYQQAQVA